MRECFITGFKWDMVDFVSRLIDSFKYSITMTTIDMYVHAGSCLWSYMKIEFNKLRSNYIHQILWSQSFTYGTVWVLCPSWCANRYEFVYYLMFTRSKCILVDISGIITFHQHIQSKHIESKNYCALDVCTRARLVYSYSLQWRRNEHDGVSNRQPHDCSLNRLFRQRSKKTSKLRVTGLCAGNSPVTGEFPAQRASNTEKVSTWWRHHVI